MMTRTFMLLSALCLGTSASAQDWTGFYAGGALSYDSFNVNDLSYGSGPVDVNGVGFGIFGGYNFQSGNLVFGAELLATKHSGDGDDGEYLRPASALHSIGLRGRLGFATGNALPYLAIGAVRTKWEADHEGSGIAGDIWSDTATGTSIALGVDWALTDTSFLRVEVERTRYGQDAIDFYNGDIHDYEMDATKISVGYAMRF